MNTPKYRLLITVLALTVLSACRIGKDYHRPALELPETLGQASADTGSVANFSWKTFFTDPQLQALIARGLERNHDLLTALKRTDIAWQQLKQARALMLPTANLNVSAQYTRPSDNSLAGLSTQAFLGRDYLENYQAGVNLSWEADIWGRIGRMKEAARAEYVQTDEGAKAVRTLLVSNIAQGYLNLLMLDEQLEIARQNLSLSDSFLLATRQLMAAGMTNDLAVQQAQSRQQTTAMLLSQVEEAIVIQENALRQLTGDLPGPVARGRLDQFSIPHQLTTGLPVALVSRRPDVRSRELALVSANARIGAAKAAMYPALNITAGTGLESFKSSNWFDIPGSVFGLAAGAVAQPLLQRRTLKTRLETAKLERDQREIEFKQSVLQATTEVANALTRIEKLQERETLAAARAGSMQTAVSQSQLLFRSGMADYLDVITVHSNALQSQLDLSAIRREELGAVVELYRALGGGWK